MKCSSCDIEITGKALMVDGKPYCCRGCAEGGPCICSYEGDLGRYPRNGHHDLLALPDLFEGGP